MRYLFLFLVCFFLGIQCTVSGNTHLVEIKNQMFKRSLEKYLEALSKRHDIEKVVTANFEINHDTIAVGLVNSITDLEVTTINGISTVKDYRICFVGIRPMTSFYADLAIQEIPKDIM